MAANEQEALITRSFRLPQSLLDWLDSKSEEGDRSSNKTLKRIVQQAKDDEARTGALLGTGGPQ